VKDGLANGMWMKGLHRINSPELTDNFVSFWNSLQSVTLSSDEDSISGSNALIEPTLLPLPTLHVSTEESLNLCWLLLGTSVLKAKSIFFRWLLLQTRLWTAVRLEKRVWPHLDRCSLCDQAAESANHLFLTCPFAKEVWHKLSSSNSAVANIGNRSTSIPGWWKKISRFRKSKTHKDLATVVVYSTN
jgi:hypothetical protein